MSTLQLRYDLISEGHLEDFVVAWLANVRPLRERFGFTVQAWKIPSESRFIWILGLDGSEADFEERDRAYYASPERAEIDPDPAQWIAEAQHSFVQRVV